MESVFERPFEWITDSVHKYTWFKKKTRNRDSILSDDHIE